MKKDKNSAMRVGLRTLFEWIATGFIWYTQRTCCFIQSWRIECIECGNTLFFSFKQCNNNIVTHLQDSSSFGLIVSSCFTIICYVSCNRPTGRCTTSIICIRYYVYDENGIRRNRKISVSLCICVCLCVCVNTFQLVVCWRLKLLPSLV